MTLRLLKRYRPDFVIASFGFNDARESQVGITDEEVFGRIESTGGRIGGLLNKLHLVVFLRGMVSKSPERTHGGNSKVPRMTPLEYENAMKNLVSQVRRTGAYLIILSISVPRRYYAVLKKVSEERDVPLVDSEDLLNESTREAVCEPPQFVVNSYEHVFERTFGILEEEMVKARVKQNFFLEDFVHPNSYGHCLIACQLGKVISKMRLD